MTTSPPADARTATCAGRGLAGGEALLGRFQPVVGGVADQVDQRIGQPLDHGLVDLGGLALGRQLDRSCRCRAPGRGPGGGSGRTGATGTMRSTIMVSRSSPARRSISSETARRAMSLLECGELLEARLGDDQLADAVHQLVEALGRHADALAGLGLGRWRRCESPGIGDGCAGLTGATAGPVRRRRGGPESRQQRPSRGGGVRAPRSRVMSSMTKMKTSSIAERP
jgi:hypothetical protein